MAKILGVCGSPRGKSGTAFALKESLKAAEKWGVETELITLRGKKLNFCINCDKCIREESKKCLVYTDDDMSSYYDSFYEADGYLFACPVYEMSVTAQMSAFMDRFRPCWNILKNRGDYFYDKVGGAIAVGGSRNGGQEKTIARIHDFYHTMGIMIVNLGSPGFAGASLWSVHGSYEKLTEDEIGLADARRMGERVAKTVLKMTAG